MTKRKRRASETDRRGRRDGRRGAAVVVITVIIGVALVVVLSATIVGIDLAQLGRTATDVPEIPDVTALAGTVGRARTFVREQFGRVFRDVGDTVEGGWISARGTLGGAVSEHPGEGEARRAGERPLALPPVRRKP